MGQMAPQSPSGVAGIDNGNPSAKLLQGGLQGLGNGLQTYGNEQASLQSRGGGGGMPQAPAAQPVSPAYFTPQAPQQQQQKPKGNNLAFYGGGQ